MPTTRTIVVLALIIARFAEAYNVARLYNADGSEASRHDTRRRSFLNSVVTVAAAAVAVASSAVPLPTFAMSTDPKTGSALPDLGEIETSIPSDWSDVENPFLDGDARTMFGRLDSSPDGVFYTDPRFVEHIDENAVQSMTDYISKQAIHPGDSVLDLCSSWTSHIDSNRVGSLSKTVGLGMNAKELDANSALTEWKVKDLNADPMLPYADNDFDVVLCQLSIDYLTRPLEVLKEVGRVLKPGGTVHILFSNRLFLSKAVGLWTGADDIDHAYWTGCYLHFCGGGFDKIVAKDLSTRKGRDKRISGDPLYVVTATKMA